MLERVENLRANTVRDLLALPDGELPDDVRRALELRAHAAKASAKKFKGILKALAPSGRLEHMLIYWGAGPGRASSQGGLNLQNLPRGVVQDVDSALEDIMASMGDSRNG